MRCSYRKPFESSKGLRRRVAKFLHQEIFLEDATEVGDVQPSLCRECGDRWVSTKMQISNRVLISAHLPTIRAPLEDFNFPLHDFDQSIRKFQITK